MSIIGRIFPKKRAAESNDFDLGKENPLGRDSLGLGLDDSSAGLDSNEAYPEEQMPMQMPQQMPRMPMRQSPVYSQPPQMQATNKDFELLSAKLDTLKALLDNINQRLTNLEKIAREEHEGL